MHLRNAADEEMPEGTRQWLSKVKSELREHAERMFRSETEEKVTIYFKLQKTLTHLSVSGLSPG